MIYSYVKILEPFPRTLVSYTPGLAFNGGIEDVISHVDPKLNVSHPQDNIYLRPEDFAGILVLVAGIRHAEKIDYIGLVPGTWRKRMC